MLQGAQALAERNARSLRQLRALASPGSSWLFLAKPHLKQFEECKRSVRNVPRGPPGGLGPEGALGSPSPWGDWPILQTAFTFVKLLNMRLVLAIPSFLVLLAPVVLPSSAHSCPVQNLRIV